MNLTFQTIKDRVYRVLYSNNLASPFLPLASGIIGTGNVVTISDDGSVTGSLPSATTRRFYRLEASLP